MTTGNGGASGTGWPGDTGAYDPALTRKLELSADVPMSTVKHDAEQRAIRDAQAAVEGIALPQQVEFRGRAFTLGTCDSLAPTLDFAEAAESGLDTDDPAGLAALKNMIRDAFVRVPSCGTCKECVAENYTGCPALDEGDWPRFWRLAKAVRADGEELMEVVKSAMEAQAARPTGSPSGSPSPGGTSSRKSRGTSRSPGPPLPAAFAELPAGDLIDISDALR